MRTRLDRRCAVRRVTLGVAIAAALTLTGCGGGTSLYSYTAPAAVVTADFNQNGHDDVAVAQAVINQLSGGESPGYVAVALQSTSKPGTFESSQHFGTQGNPSAMAVGALTPGTADLVVSNVNDGSISVLMQSTPGQLGFQPAQNLSAKPASVTGTVLPEDVAICDVNGDGHPDIVVAYWLEQELSGVLSPVGGGVSVLLQDPSNPGHFLPAQLLGNTPTNSNAQYPNSAMGIACTNLSGSKTAPPDVVITSSYQYDQSNDYGTVSIFTHNPASPGTFLPRIDIPLPGELHRVVVADLNGDGLPDIIVGNEGADLSGNGSSSVDVLMQQPPTAGATEPSFAAPVSYLTNSPIALAVGDVNGDGLPDIVTVTSSYSVSTSGLGNVTVLLNQKSAPGTFPTTGGTSYPGLGNPVAVALGDLSNNSLPDIVIADGGGAAVLMNSTSNPGTFSAAQSVAR